MSKTNGVFKLLTNLILVIDVLFAVFLLTWSILTFKQITVFGTVIWIVVVVLIILNVAYSIYVGMVLYLHKKKH